MRSQRQLLAMMAREGAVVERVIDADVLRQEISCKVVEGKDERY